METLVLASLNAVGKDGTLRSVVVPSPRTPGALSAQAVADVLRALAPGGAAAFEVRCDAG